MFSPGHHAVIKGFSLKCVVWTLLLLSLPCVVCLPIACFRVLCIAVVAGLVWYASTHVHGEIHEERPPGEKAPSLGWSEAQSRAGVEHGWVTIMCEALDRAPRFLLRCGLCRSPLAETINQGPIWVYACKKITYIMRTKDRVVHVRVLWLWKCWNSTL